MREGKLILPIDDNEALEVSERLSSFVSVCFISPDLSFTLGISLTGPVGDELSTSTTFVWKLWRTNCTWATLPSVFQSKEEDKVRF